MKKRLLKDLPFKSLNKGRVLTKGNGGYYIECGDTFYDGGGSSHRGWTSFTETECSLIDTIWESKEWFAEATLKHVAIEASVDKITLSFDNLDLGQAQELAKGIRSMLHKWEELSVGYSWDKYKGFTTSLK